MSASPKMHTRVCFCVDVDNLLPNEFVLVTGNIEELGKWDPQSAMPLERCSEKNTRWSGYALTNAENVQFRYFVGYRLCGEAGERLIIGRWESFRRARNVLVSVEQRNGVCRDGRVDLFGYYAGQRLISEGWLQFADEHQILLRIHGNALKFYKTAKQRVDCRLRFTPIDVRNKPSKCSLPLATATCDEEDDDDDSISSYTYPTHSSCQVAVLSDKNPRFQHQSENGVKFTNNRDYVVLKTHSVAVEFLAFFIEIISDENKRIGSCFALPSSLYSTFGLTHLPFVNSSGRPIGQVSIDYLFIRSLCRPIPTQTMEVSYCRYWKKRNALEIGHRGAGNSYTKFAMARENTIYSLNTAAKNGADFVEFDVQLTKDKVAVIYHDFHVLVSVAKRGGLQRVTEDIDSIDFHEIAVKDLKLSQVDHVSKKEKGRQMTTEAEDSDDLKPFPSLVEALERVDNDVGFNVEVKYPMMQANGEHECDHYFERNEFVDVVLSDIMNHAGERRIVFSSFDPDICSLIQYKQNKYPVLFLCIGETQRYTPFSDQRSSTSLTAVNFAAGADILGVNFNSEDLLKDPYPVQRATELGLVSFVWGDDLDRKETINYFKRELGVDGLIYDRIGEEERRRNVFIVEREQKKAIFMASSGHNTPRAPSPVDSIASTTSSTAPISPPADVDISIPMNNMHIQPRIEIQQS